MYTRQQILDVMSRVYDDSRMVLFGEQCGTSGKPANVISNYADKSGGHKPAILGIDLACYGIKLPQIGVGSEEWKEYIDQLTEYAEEGGIITASSHLANPMWHEEYGALCRGIFGGPEAWEEMLTEGTELNRIVKEELIIDGKFLKELDDKGIPVLWRPLHEANGGWFWFGARSHSEMDWIDPEYLRRFWRYIYNLYVNEMGMKNLIWVYGPNVSQNTENGTRNVLYYYPGDEYVDIVGVDWYTSKKNELNYPGHSYDRLMSTGKIAAITEFGPSGALRVPRGLSSSEQEKMFSSVDAVDVIKSFVKRGLKIAYVLTWAGGCGAFYFLGKAKEALDDPFCIDLERLKKLYK